MRIRPNSIGFRALKNFRLRSLGISSTRLKIQDGLIGSENPEESWRNHFWTSEVEKMKAKEILEPFENYLLKQLMPMAFLADFCDFGDSDDSGDYDDSGDSGNYYDSGNHYDSGNYYDSGDSDDSDDSGNSFGIIGKFWNALPVVLPPGAQSRLLKVHCGSLWGLISHRQHSKLFFSVDIRNAPFCYRINQRRRILIT